MSKILIKFTGFQEEIINLCTSILEEAKIKTGNYALITKTYCLEKEEKLKCIDIILEDEVILNPYDNNNNQIDFMISISQETFEEFKNNTKEKGIIVIDSNMVKASVNDKNKWKIYEIPIDLISKEEIKEEKTQVALALAITNFMTKENIKNDILEETMLSKVPQELHLIYKKAFEVGLQYAKKYS